MKQELTFDDYVALLGIEDLSKKDQIHALTEVAKAVHNQFLLDMYDVVGEDNFNAIKTSIKLGPALYVTTLKHILPGYLAIYDAAKQKVFEKLKATNPTPSV